MTTRFKICCIANRGEVELAIRAGASAVGLVSAMPSGPGVIAETDICSIAAHVPPGVSSFLLTSLTDAESVIAQQRRCRCDVLQLCDAFPVSGYATIRAALSGIRIVQVIHVVGDESVDDAAAAASHVDAILLDSGNPKLATKLLGGTGRVHDWAVSRRIVEACDVPVWLAGGLNPTNACQAIEAVRPFGLDICSGVRTEGELDLAKLDAFAAAVREAA